MERITEVLQAMGRGAPGTHERLVGLVYGELRRIAESLMRRQPPQHTLQPTALLNEAWLRLMAGNCQPWQNRAHFLRAAATAMRSILVDYARSRSAAKRGSGRRRRVLDELAHAGSGASWEVLAVNEALERLEAEDPVMGRLVELRFFCGLTMVETARVLGIAPRSAYKIWAHARAWLYREITG